VIVSCDVASKKYDAVIAAVIVPRPTPIIPRLIAYRTAVGHTKQAVKTVIVERFSDSWSLTVDARVSQ